jgi:hypothetical protein
MNIVPAFVALAAAATLGLPEPAVRHEAAAAGSVKFTNNSNGTATVRANGAVLFADVATGQTTDWASVSDSMVTFVMVTTQTEADSATVTQKVVEGARYALVGTVVEGKPVLTISASQAPAPAPGGPRR